MEMSIILTTIALIVLVIVVVRYFNRIGNAVDKTISDSYYHHQHKNKIIYSPMGNWFELGYKELNADPSTFIVLARDYGKDKNNIYWKGVVQTVDHGSFVIDEHGTPKDALHVYYDRGYQPQLAIIADADPESFKPYKLPQENYNQQWARDNKAIYLYGRKVNVDAKTFMRINQSFAADSQAIYAIVYDNRLQTGTGETNTNVVRQAQRPLGNPESINDFYVRFGNTLMHSSWKNPFSSIEFDVIDTITLINERNIVVNNVLISDGKTMKGVDVNTVEIINRDLIKDKTNVYFDKEKIEGADASTIVSVSEFYSKDKNSVYYKTKRLNGTTPATFTINYATNVASDGKHSFKDGVALETN